MIGIGIAGLGFMGMIHSYAARRIQHGSVVAFSTRNAAKRAGDWSMIQGNFGPRGSSNEDLTGVEAFETIDELIEHPEIDLIDVCLPTDQHTEVAMKALRAGKHVLLEKPISLDITEADLLVQEAEQAGKHLLVAHVLPFFPEFRYVRQVVQSGEFGKLVGGHFKRIISQPNWSADIASLERTGGPAIDLHIHDTHFIGLICGMPKEVFSRGKTQGNHVEYLTTHYIYDDPELCITCSSGAVSQGGRPFTHGFEIYLEQATILFEFATLGDQPELLMPLTVLTADGGMNRPELGSGDPIDSFAAEIEHAVAVVQGEKQEAELSGQLARDALLLCLKEAESVKSGQCVRVV